jgi:ABC-type lipoprotein export system ATPase subunit
MTAADRGVGVHLEGLVHLYHLPETEVVALRGVDLDVDAGETVALLGPSGSGKSTVLGLVAGVLRPSAGRVYVGTHELSRMSARQVAALRGRTIGVVLQEPARNLLPYSTSLDNVEFARAACPRPLRRSLPSSKQLLEQLGIEALAHKVCGRLSGGEQQRLAIAVAVAAAPALLLADEPTSQLDAESRGAVIDLLRLVRERVGSTVMVVTHDPAIAAALPRTVTIRDGRVGAEGHKGEEFAVVGRDGAVQLPPDVLDQFPAGTLLRVTRRADAVEFRAVERTTADDTGDLP